MHSSSTSRNSDVSTLQDMNALVTCLAVLAGSKLSCRSSQRSLEVFRTHSFNAVDKKKLEDSLYLSFELLLGAPPLPQPPATGSSDDTTNEAPSFSTPQT